MMNPWKLTALGLVVVAATSLITGIVVANYTGSRNDRPAATVTQPTPPPAAAVPTPPTAVAAPTAHAAVAPAPRRVSHVAAAPKAPSREVIEACNEYAGRQASQRDKTLAVLKDTAIGAVAGAAMGAAGGAIADGGKGAGKGAAIGGVVGAGAGTLYGLNDNRKHDDNYRAAYSACMSARGYSS